jgi:DNA mismatch repair protein MutL
MINGRFIKNYSIARAIQDGYHTLLPIGRYPVVLLNVEMDPLLVDVNVHPSKMEVRISKEQELTELITNAIQSNFKTKTLIPSGTIPVKQDRPKSEQTTLILDEKPILRSETTFSTQNLVKEPLSVPFMEQEVPTEYKTPVREVESDVVVESQEESETLDEVVLSVSSENRVPMLYPIGQMHGTYILAQNEMGLYIIDQHAAQERIKYEYYREKVGQVENELQELLVPLTFEYAANEYMKMVEYQKELEQVGLFFEEFGTNCFIIRSHPQWFPKGMEKEIIEEMIEQLLEMKKVDVKKLREEAAIMMSCKASIKANHHLRTDEIQALLNDLRNSSDPFTCPHGRPIIIHYSTYEMEKMFKRVM